MSGFVYLMHEIRGTKNTETTQILKTGQKEFNALTKNQERIYKINKLITN